MSEGLKFSNVHTQGPTEKLPPLFDPGQRDRVFSRGRIKDEDLLS